MIAVSNIQLSLDFYTEKLGFELVSPQDQVKEWKWFTVRRDQVEIMVTQTENGNLLKPGEEDYFSCILYFYPDNIDELYQEYKDKKLELSALDTTFYGMKEFSLRDPDRHLLSFGQDV